MKKVVMASEIKCPRCHTHKVSITPYMDDKLEQTCDIEAYCDACHEYFYPLVEVEDD